MSEDKNNHYVNVNEEDNVMIEYEEKPGLSRDNGKGRYISNDEENMNIKNKKTSYS